MQTTKNLNPPPILKKSKRYFTLLEIMVAIAILAIGAGAVAWRMQSAVRKKEFSSEIERLRTRIVTTQKLAVSMQADWSGTLIRKGNEWVFETVSEEGRRFVPLHLKSLQVQFNGKKLTQPLSIDFCASGQVLPEGELLFTCDSEKISWTLPEIFQKKEGQTHGPVCPD